MAGIRILDGTEPPRSKGGLKMKKNSIIETENDLIIFNKLITVATCPGQTGEQASNCVYINSRRERREGVTQIDR